MPTEDNNPNGLSPAFYAAPSYIHKRRSREWWLLAHPPYSLCHLSFVVIGACLKGPVNATRLGATFTAFLLAVGIGAHALDELHDRPLGTNIPAWQLASAATIGLGGACALGIYGALFVNSALAYFIVVGVIVAIGYNLELFRGSLHNNLVFALGWGGFPVLTSYFAQHATIDLTAILGGSFASFIALAQRHLSTPARSLRRSTLAVDGTVTTFDGRKQALTRQALLAPLERALSYLCWASVFIALALAYARFKTRL